MVILLGTPSLTACIKPGLLTFAVLKAEIGKRKVEMGTRKGSGAQFSDFSLLTSSLENRGLPKASKVQIKR